MAGRKLGDTAATVLSDAARPEKGVTTVIGGLTRALSARFKGNVGLRPAVHGLGPGCASAAHFSIGA